MRREDQGQMITEGGGQGVIGERTPFKRVATARVVCESQEEKELIGRFLRRVRPLPFEGGTIGTFSAWMRASYGFLPTRRRRIPSVPPPLPQPPFCSHGNLCELLHRSSGRTEAFSLALSLQWERTAPVPRLLPSSRALRLFAPRVVHASLRTAGFATRRSIPGSVLLPWLFVFWGVVEGSVEGVARGEERVARSEVRWWGWEKTRAASEGAIRRFRDAGLRRTNLETPRVVVARSGSPSIFEGSRLLF